MAFISSLSVTQNWTEIWISIQIFCASNEVWTLKCNSQNDQSWKMHTKGLSIYSLSVTQN